MSVFSMRPIQTAISIGMNHIRTNVIARVESLTGFEIKYSSIRPTIFGSFDIRNLRLIKNDKDFLSIPMARVYFSLFDMIKGNKAIIKSIQIEHPSFDLDLEKDKDTLEFLSLLFSKRRENKLNLQQIAEYFPDNPYLHIRDCFVSVTAGSSKYKVQNMNFDIKGDNEMIFLTGSFGAEYNNTNIFNRVFAVKTEVEMNGECTVDLEEGNAVLAFMSTAGEDFTVSPLKLSLNFNENVLSVLTLSEDDYISSSFIYNVDTKSIFAALNCNEFPLSQVIKFSDDKKDVNKLLAMTISGSSFFQYENTGEMQYNVNLQTGNLSGSSEHFVIRTHGNEKQIVFDDFRFFSFKNGKLDLSGKLGFSPLAASGNVSFDKFNLGTNEYLHGNLKILTQKNEIQINSERLKMGKTALDEFNIYIQPSKKSLGIVFSALCEKQGTIDVFANYSGSPRQLEASITLDSFPIIDLLDMTEPFTDRLHIPPVAHGVVDNPVITTEIFFTTDFNQFVYNAPRMTIDIDGAFANLSFSGTDKRFILSESVISKDDMNILVSAQANFSNPMDLGFSFNANYQDFSWRIEGQIIDKNILVIRDPNGLNAYLSLSNTGALSGYLQGVDFPVPVSGGAVYLNFYASLRYTDKTFWNIDVNHVRARSSLSLTGADFLRVSGSVDQDGAHFRDFLFIDYIGTLTGSLDFSWNNDFSHIQYFINITDGKNAGEYYTAEGVLKKNHFSTKASFTQMRLDRFLKGKNSAMILNGKADILWESFKSFNANIDIDSFNANVNDNNIKAQAKAILNNNELSVNNLTMDYSSLNIYVPVVNLNRIEGTINAQTQVKGLVIHKRLEGNMELNANFAQIDSWLEIKQILNSINGSVKTGYMQWGVYDQQPCAFIFAKDKGSLSISGGPKDMLQLQMDNGGNFFASVSSPFPIQATLVGHINNGNIDAHSNDFFMDLSSFWNLMPREMAFKITAGYITGKVDVKGPILNPEFFGSAKASSLRFSVPDFIGDEIKPVPFNVVLEGSDMIFRSVALTVGSGSGTADGWVRFENWRPNAVNLDITIPRSTPIPYKLNVIGFLANGNAAGKFLLGLENKVLNLTGDLIANNTELGLSIDDILSRGDREYSEQRIPVIVNMTVTTGPVVEFIWPNTNMPILRANPEMGTVANIFADTANRQYSINSDIVLRSGEIYYFDRSFYIRQGNLVFRENELKFSPRISARAEIRDRTDSGLVTISMIIDNQPLFSFDPRFEASPALTQLEIYSLLGHNFYAQSGTETAAASSDNAQKLLLSSTTDVMAQVLASTDFFGQFAAVRQFERMVRNTLNLDMFSVRTKFLQNAVVTNVTNATSAANAANTANSNTTGQNPVDRNSRVGNYFDNTTVFVGKYVGQDMFIQGMLAVRYDENKTTLSGLKFEPDIGIELQSPLFNIRWDFFPYNPQNWWVNDNSITLYWSKSF
jgi:hypothetical protein